MRWRWLDAKMSTTFFTFHETARAIGLGRASPLVATALMITLGGALLLVIIDLCAIGAGQVARLPGMQTPRGVAGAAVLGGYFVWNEYASPERIAPMESLRASESAAQRKRRRIKVWGLAVLVAVGLLELSRAA